MRRWPVPGGEDESEQAAHRQAGDENAPKASQPPERVLGRGFPVPIRDAFERFRRASVAGKADRSDMVSARAQRLPQGPHIPGASGETMEQQACLAAFAELERRGFFWVQGERAHGDKTP